MKIISFLLLGLLTSLLFPPYFLTPMGFIIFPLLSFIFSNINKYSNINIFSYGFFFGLGFFGNLLIWIINPFFVFEETSSYFFISFLLIIFLSLILGIIFLITIAIFNKKISFFYIIPIIFILTELIISRLLYGFPWLTFTLTISNIDILLVLTKFFGTFFTSCIIIFLFNIPYLLFESKSKQVIKNLYVLFSLPTLLFIILIFNYQKTNEYKFLTTQIFQINKSIFNSENQEQKTYNKIQKSIISSDADVIIFAENNYPGLVSSEINNNFKKNIKNNQTLIIGGTKFKNNRYYNSLVKINTTKTEYFDKIYLVPFGEFLPLRDLLKFFQIIVGPVDYTKGEKDRLIIINNKISFIPVICYEIIFYWDLVNSLNFDSDLIINITNDVWFGKYIGPYQHFYLSKIRAAEFNKPLVRVSNNGISAFINNKGKILDYIPLNKTNNLKYKLKIRNAQSFYKVHRYLNYSVLGIIFTMFIYFYFKRNDQQKI